MKTLKIKAPKGWTKLGMDCAECNKIKKIG